MKDEQSMNKDRRGFLSSTLKVIPVAAVAVSGAGVHSAAQALPGAPGSVNSLDEFSGSFRAYSPTYFTDEEYAFLQSAVDILIPSDDAGPGALAACVPEFLDRQMDTPYAHGQLWYMKGPFNPEIMQAIPTLGYQLNMTPRDIYRSGIAAFNLFCTKQYGLVFKELEIKEKNEAMTLLGDGKLSFSDDFVPAAVFFEQLWQNTKEGFFSDPMYGGNRGMVGWKMVGFPGARGDFLDWSGKYEADYPLGPVPIIPKKINRS